MSLQNNLHNLRNIGIIAHIDAGKTTLTERILFYTRKIHRMGEVHNGTATMDYLPEEQERGITITSACTTCTWQQYTINIIDTPGHVDFTIEVERSLRVLDGAIGVFCAVGGVEPQSETVWRQSENCGVPKLIFVNKLDRTGADFAAVLTSLRTRLGIIPVPLYIPHGEGDAFAGIFDIIRMAYLDFDQDTQGQSYTRRPCTPAEEAQVQTWREQSLETLAEADDVFLEAYCNAQYTENDIIAALRRATIARRITPVLCGAALRNVGVQPLLDAIGALLPSPCDIPLPLGRDAHGVEHPIAPDTKAPCIALVFKIIMEGSRKIAFMRLYAGTVQEGDSICNVSQKCDDKVQRIYRVHADRREQLPHACVGDIVAVVGLRTARTGSTYAHPARPLLLETIGGYEPVITLALEPRNADEGSTLDDALTRFTTEDPTLSVIVDEGSGHRMISGMGELHLDILLERIAREYGISPRAGHPQVVRRETIRTTATAEAEFDRDLGKDHHYGKVQLSIMPLPRGTGNSIRLGDFYPQDIKDAAKAYPQHWVDAVIQGLHDALQSGAVTGYPLQDIAITVMDIVKKESVSSAPGYHMAAGMALRQALAEAKPIALEPIMAVEITVPENALGAAINHFTTCSGRVENICDRAGHKVMQGFAPLSTLFGFSTNLRSATQGRAGLILTFNRFDVA